jgi:hypothetical protein
MTVGLNLPRFFPGIASTGLRLMVFETALMVVWEEPGKNANANLCPPMLSKTVGIL